MADPFDLEFYQRQTYDRNTLLQYRSCPTARIRPSGLPDYPEIILDKALSIEEPRRNQNGEYTNRYVWKLPPEKNGTKNTMIKSRLENSHQDVHVQRTNSNESKEHSKKEEVKEKGKYNNPTALDVPYRTPNSSEKVTLANTVGKDITPFMTKQKRGSENEKIKFKDATNVCDIEKAPEAVASSLGPIVSSISDRGLYIDQEETLKNTLNNCDNNKIKPTRVKDKEIDSKSESVCLTNSAAITDISFGYECGILCDNCTEEMEKAVAFCVICNDFLCLVCCKVHQRSKLSKHHQLLHGDNMPTEKVDLSYDGICDKHVGELKLFYCTKHKNFYCPVCVTLQHKRRCDIKYISEIAESFEESEDYKTLNEKLHDMVNRFGSCGTLLKKRISSKEIISKQITAQIYAYRSKVDRVLDKMVETVLCKRDSFLDAHIHFLMQASSTCSEYKKEVTEALARMKKLENYPQRNALVFEAKRAESKVTEFESVIDELQSTILSNNFKFTPNERLLDLLDSFADYGTMDITKEDSNNL